VFTNSVGGPVDPARSRYDFHKVAGAANLGDGWTPNMLPHTCASLMSDAGAPLELVADQLGHRDTRMASLHYRHRVRPTVSGGATMAEVLSGSETDREHRTARPKRRSVLVTRLSVTANLSLIWAALEPTNRKVSNWVRISNRNDVDQVLDPDQVCRVAGVQAGAVGVRCRCDQQVHHP